MEPNKILVKYNITKKSCIIKPLKMLSHTYIPISKAHDKYHRLSVMFTITANKKGKIAEIQNALANYLL